MRPSSSRAYFTPRLILIAAVQAITLNISAQAFLGVHADSILSRSSFSAPALEQKISVSLSAAPLKDVIEGLAHSTRLNLAIDNSIQGSVTAHLTDVSAREFLIYLCRSHNMAPELKGSIIYLTRAPGPVKPKMQLVWNDSASTISVAANNDSLRLLAEKFNELTGSNMILSERLMSRTFSFNVREMPLESFLQSLAKAWSLQVRRIDDMNILLDSDPIQNSPNSASLKWPEGIDCKLEADGRISIRGKDIEAAPALLLASRLAGESLVIACRYDQKRSLNLESAGFEELLDHMTTGSGLVWERVSGTYIVHDPGIVTQTYRFMKRSADAIPGLLPASLTNQVELSLYPELNTMIVRGKSNDVLTLCELLRELDDSIPVVLLEIVIIDHHMSNKVKTGISAKLASDATETGGTLFPAPDITLGTSGINNILRTFNGFGWLNLGYIRPEISLELSALEQQGQLEIRASPKLSTLSGHEATMSIGTTEYYIEERNDVIGTQNPQNIQTRQYKSVNADFSLRIHPYVTGDGKIMMSVEVEQSDFTTRISPDAPPGKVSRKFTSMLCIEDGHTAVLGGLEERNLKGNSSGLPLISRIPVLKWLFSSREWEKKKSNLVILIKPVIVK